MVLRYSSLYLYGVLFGILFSLPLVLFFVFLSVNFYIYLCVYTDDYYILLNSFFKVFFCYYDRVAFFCSSIIDSFNFLDFDSVIFFSFYYNISSVFYFFSFFDFWFYVVDSFYFTSGSLRSGFFTVYFSTDILISSSSFVFEPLQNYICIQVDEPVIVFFKLSNFSNETRRFISLYDVVPFYLYPYLKKIQCFCFDEILVKPSEVLILPLFFVLDSSFVNDFNPDFSSIHISYSLILSS